jgi:hypothetical protein
LPENWKGQETAMNQLPAEVAWHGNLGEKALGNLVVVAAQHRYEIANRGNRNGVEALEEVVEHQAVLPGETEGDGAHGRNSCREILLPAQNLNRMHYAYQTASAEEVPSF